jgi:hypothetical protein
LRYRKRVAAVALLVLIAALLSGCIQMVMGVEIHEDGTGAVRMQTGVLESMIEEAGDQMDLEGSAEDAREQGYTVSPYSSDGYSGYVYEKSFSDVESMNRDDVMMGMKMQMETGDEGGKKVIVWNVESNMADQMEDGSGLSVDALKQMSNMDLRFMVTLPYPITETNAHSLSNDGRTATWDLLDAAEMGTFTARAVEGSAGLSLWVIILIVVAVVIAVVVVLIVVFSTKRKRQAEAEKANAEVLADAKAAAEQTLNDRVEPIQGEADAGSMTEQETVPEMPEGETAPKPQEAEQAEDKDE